MATITVQTITESGITPTFASATAEGDVMDNDGKTFLMIKNGSGGSITVTITAQVTSVKTQLFGETTKSNATIAVGAGAEGMIGPFSPSAFNTNDSQISITYSGVTGVTVAGFKLNN
tara:strand:+ start:352 stop:702 length:351 start_codon:yes stop_codon:yes gene_type:complete